MGCYKSMTDYCRKSPGDYVRIIRDCSTCPRYQRGATRFGETPGTNWNISSFSFSTLLCHWGHLEDIAGLPGNWHMGGYHLGEGKQKVDTYSSVFFLHIYLSFPLF